MQICFKSKTTGNRHSGRNVLKYLSDCDLKSSKVLNQDDGEICGLNTAEMPEEDKEAFAYMLFDSIERGITMTLRDNPDDPELIDDYRWFIENKPNLIDGFKDNDLTFNLGYMVFRASGKEKNTTPEP